ncbi:uncharacterized protein DDB_G0290301-like [Solanum tuberosum]|uniref:uncharacterized protein DDB_G0290301-like n=1 Tax=Solanum tuberosum TaxID=4113 RepID=UPI00073A50A0|nr:PREDICTED: uncharacterized protein DDB_G0290301-like [Solanum tuberosum]
MKNINQGEQGQQGTDHRQVRPREQEEQQHQNTKERSNQQPPEQQKEAEWQVSKRRNNKPQEEITQKAVWRPTSPQNKVSKEHPQPTVQQTGINNSSNHNSFTNLNMQGKQTKDIQGHSNNERKTPQGTKSMSKTNHNQKYRPCKQENKQITRAQEGVSKGGNLTHVLHEGIHTEHNPDFRASATPIPHQAMTKQQQKLQQKHTETTQNTREQQGNTTERGQKNNEQANEIPETEKSKQ